MTEEYKSDEICIKNKNANHSINFSVQSLDPEKVLDQMGKYGKYQVL